MRASRGRTGRERPKRRRASSRAARSLWRSYGAYGEQSRSGLGDPAERATLGLLVSAAPVLAAETTSGDTDELGRPLGRRQRERQLAAPPAAAGASRSRPGAAAEPCLKLPFPGEAPYVFAAPEGTSNGLGSRILRRKRAFAQAHSWHDPRALGAHVQTGTNPRAWSTLPEIARVALEWTEHGVD
jgi:hypothetical protein